MTILQQVLDAVAAVVPADAGRGVAAEFDGNAIADNLKTFIAPIVAIIIGVMGLKFLAGEQKSLSGFIGFLLLAFFVFALIMWGQPILDTAANTIKRFLGA